MGRNGPLNHYRRFPARCGSTPLESLPRPRLPEAAVRWAIVLPLLAAAGSVPVGDVWLTVPNVALYALAGVGFARRTK